MRTFRASPVAVVRWWPGLARYSSHCCLEHSASGRRPHEPRPLPPSKKSKKQLAVAFDTPDSKPSAQIWRFVLTTRRASVVTRLPHHHFLRATALANTPTASALRSSSWIGHRYDSVGLRSVRREAVLGGHLSLPCVSILPQMSNSRAIATSKSSLSELAQDHPLKSHLYPSQSYHAMIRRPLRGA